MSADSNISLRDSEEKLRLIVYAVNVHSGGGASLLSAILEEFLEVDELVLFCDQRMCLPPSINSRISVNTVEPSLVERLRAERKLRDLAQNKDVVLAFGNLPPVYSLTAKVVLFLQNRYLVDPKMPLAGFNVSARLRIFLERMWLRSRICNVDRVIVQTQTMSELFELAFGRPAEVIALRPIHESKRTSVVKGSTTSQKQYDFVYVSSGEPHKNHRVLIEAWVCLAKSGFKPSLALTLDLDKNKEILELVNASNDNFGTKIINLGQLVADDVEAVYQSSAALIFPSTGESFGLPLLEAAEQGLPILAGELDYVRDLVDPVESFDPRSPRSIARAVMRFLKLPSYTSGAIGPAAFLRRICEVSS